jgi:hypothetical protein
MVMPSLEILVITSQSLQTHPNCAWRQSTSRGGKTRLNAGRRGNCGNGKSIVELNLHSYPKELCEERYELYKEG